MPITEFMNGFRTDPETRRLMGLAFELTRVTLRLSDRKDPIIQLVADRIIELAKTGERNPERLCDLALASIRREMNLFMSDGSPALKRQLRTPGGTTGAGLRKS